MSGKDRFAPDYRAALQKMKKKNSNFEINADILHVTLKQ